MSFNKLIYFCSLFRRHVRKLQEMCYTVRLVSSLISVKHLVEEQCFSKPSSTWKHAVLMFLSNNFWLIALTTNTCAFTWTNPRSEVSTSDRYTEERRMNGSVTGHSLWSPFWYPFWPLSLLWIWPLNLLWNQKQELHFIHISYYWLLFCFCFSWWKTSQNYWNTKSIDANL